MGKKLNMPKTFEKIESSAVEISVARNGALKPYIACFEQRPDNIAKESLGILSGVFVIGDRSEESEYIVNFLASLAKKEYYANPRRGAMESFEAALHKINLGLSELIKEGNTQWIGTLDAAVCVIERNNFHFSVAGKAKVLLFREQKLSDISEGIAEENDIHPMKTFTDVASGKMLPNDRVIVSTSELFTIISLQELERSAHRLSVEAFERFLRTAIINQLDLCAILSIGIRQAEIRKKPEEAKRVLASPDSVPNVWDRKIFENSKPENSKDTTKAPDNDTAIETQMNSKVIAEEIDNAPDKEKSERVDGRNIYVVGETPAEPKNELWERTLFFIENIRGAFSQRVSRMSRRATSVSIRTSKGAILSAKKKFTLTKESFIEWRNQRSTLREEHLKATEQERVSHAQAIVPPTKSAQSEVLKVAHPKKNDVARFEQSPTIHKNSTITSIITETQPTTSRRVTDFFQERAPKNTMPKETSFASPLLPKMYLFAKTVFGSMLSITQRCIAILSTQTKKAYIAFRRLSPKQKAITIGGIAIFIIILIALSLFSEKEPEPAPISLQEPIIETPKHPLINETNIRFIENIQTIPTEGPILDIVSFNDSAFAIGETAVTRIDQSNQTTRTEYPNGMRAFRSAIMPTLNMLLIMTENGKLVSYFPSTQKFEDNAIVAPSNASIADMAVSSTYLYILDAEKDAIYRFPRDTGGFGKSLSWLKEAVSIEQNSRFAISESIFITESTSKLSAYSRGTKQAITFGSSSTTISFDDIYADEDGTSVFILDSVHGRIIEYDKNNGSILAQYANDQFKNATHFTIDTKMRIAYVLAKTSILKAELK